MKKQSNTVNRGWLKKQIAAGNVEIKTNYIHTDDYAFDASVKSQASDWVKADIANYSDDDFQYTSGRAYWNDDRTEIKWYMLANHCYTCRIIKK